MVASSKNLPATSRISPNLVALNFRVPLALRQQIKAQAALRGMSMTDFGIAAMQNYLEQLSSSAAKVVHLDDCKKS